MGLAINSLGGKSLVKPTTAMLKKMYHMTFERRIKGVTEKRHTLLINPEDFSQNEPARANVTQTLGGAYVDDFGQGLLQITIAGTTGYKARYSTEGLYVDGYEEFSLFRKNVYRDFVTANDPAMTLHWFNWEDNEHYQIQPVNFRLQRNARQPLLYRYEFQFICIRNHGSIHKIFDNLMNDTTFQLLGSLAGGGLKGLGKSLLGAGMSGTVGKTLGKLGVSQGTMNTVAIGAVLLGGKSAKSMGTSVLVGSAAGDILGKAKSKASAKGISSP